MRMIVANGGVAAGLDENDGQPLIDEREKCACGPLGLLAGVIQKALRNERPAAADSRGDGEIPTGGKSEFGGGDGNWRLMKIGKSVSEEGDRGVVGFGISIKPLFLLVPPFKERGASKVRRRAVAIEAEQSIHEPTDRGAGGEPV